MARPGVTHARVRCQILGARCRSYEASSRLLQCVPRSRGAHAHVRCVQWRVEPQLAPHERGGERKGREEREGRGRESGEGEAPLDVVELHRGALVLHCPSSTSKREGEGVCESVRERGGRTCGMTVRRERSTWSGTVAMFTPSMRMAPAWIWGHSRHSSAPSRDFSASQRDRH
jgi:hypothetical protein